jgi:ABC-type nitrate/sulfonate/bicarbonate transport system substrate-binding protein
VTVPDQVTRRRLIAAGGGVVALGTLPGGIAVRAAMAADTKVRMSTGIRATTQCISWIGSEAGVFRKHGLDVSFPKLEVGGPEAAIGMTRGDWEFCQTGTLPIAEGVLNGRDPVILLRNTAQHAGLFVMTRREFTTLDQLAGKRVGVLTDAYSGQTGVNTRRTVEKAGVTATYVGLGTYQKIYAALAAGEIDAGAVPIDLRFSGERQYGWHAFETASLRVPNIFATTRRLIASNRDLVMRAVRGMVETIHVFKTQPDVVVPLLQRFLNINDRKSVEDLHKFYVPLFPSAPRPSLSEGMQDVRDAFSKKYPAAQKLQESDIADSSFIDELEKSGFIQRLYAGDPKR